MSGAVAIGMYLLGGLRVHGWQRPEVCLHCGAPLAWYQHLRRRSRGVAGCRADDLPCGRVVRTRRYSF
jgi:hypothetical protein